MSRRLLVPAAAIVLAACSPATALTSAESSTPAPATTPSVQSRPADQDAIRGPGGMTLSEEIGAVMMVGFHGPLTEAVSADWQARQFGGLLIVPDNQNVRDAAGTRALIGRVRGVMRRPVLVATDEEGGSVCLRESGVPCLAGARQAGPRGPSAVRAEMRTMAAGLRSLGFDVDLAPVADVWDGVHPFMAERSYGRDPRAVAQDVTAAIAGIHEAGLLAAAKHFPGHGAADGDSHVELPRVALSADTLRARDWVPFQAAVQDHVDFVMVGHLDVPALDPAAPSSMSKLVMDALRQQVGYQGVVISDDLEMGALGSRFPAPDAAVRFLENGGDMVIVEHDIQVADATFDAIHSAVVSGAYPRTQLDASVQKLMALQLRFMP